MKMMAVIQKAIEGGWNGHLPYYLINPELLLDPNWWQALGRGLGVQFTCLHYGMSPVSQGIEMQWWQYQWHKFIDHLAANGSVEAFFEEL